MKASKLRNDTLVEKIKLGAQVAHPIVNEVLDQDLQTMLLEHAEVVNSAYPTGSFQQLFGNGNSRQQEQAIHILCDGTHSLSSGAYTFVNCLESI